MYVVWNWLWSHQMKYRGVIIKKHAFSLWNKCFWILWILHFFSRDVALMRCITYWAVFKDVRLYSRVHRAVDVFPDGFEFVHLQFQAQLCCFFVDWLCNLLQRRSCVESQYFVRCSRTLSLVQGYVTSNRIGRNTAQWRYNANYTPQVALEKNVWGVSFCEWKFWYKSYLSGYSSLSNMLYWTAL